MLLSRSNGPPSRGAAEMRADVRMLAVWPYSNVAEYFRLLLEEPWTKKTTHKGKPWTGPLQVWEEGPLLLPSPCTAQTYGLLSRPWGGSRLTWCGVWAVGLVPFWRFRQFEDKSTNLFMSPSDLALVEDPGASLATRCPGRSLCS